MITYELDITYTISSDTTIITYEIELPPAVKKIGFNLLYDKYFTAPYVTGTTPNLPAGHQLPTQAKLNMCIIDISREDPITSQSALGELNSYQNTNGKSKVRISIWRSKIYQRTDLEDIRYIFYQVRPVVSHLEFSIPEKTFSPNKIGGNLKGPHRKL